MRRSRFSEEQIIGIVKEHQAGRGVAELCRKYGISDATFGRYGRGCGSWRPNAVGSGIGACTFCFCGKAGW